LSLLKLQVADFRCLQQAALEFDPRFTFLWGPNAAGKTSVLEAIYLLGRGRSFRTKHLEHLIRRGAQRCIVQATLAAVAATSIAIEGSAQGVKARINGEPGSLADLALALPVQVIDPDVHKIIEEGPGARRRFLDWGVFHVEPQFVSHWRAHRHILKQRNASLRARQAPVLTRVWDAGLVRTAEFLTGARDRYVQALADPVDRIGRELLGLPIALEYRRGWNPELSFPEALDASWSLDSERGLTQVGPQRAEVIVRVDGILARDKISRGQQKLLAASLLLAQLALFDGAGRRPVLLLDDPAAELDSEHLAAFIREVTAQTVQLVVTSLTPTHPGFGMPQRRYRLENGVVYPG
jgi:DNA replication and repair protein RecF